MSFWIAYIIFDCTIGRIRYADIEFHLMKIYVCGVQQNYDFIQFQFIVYTLDYN